MISGCDQEPVADVLVGRLGEKLVDIALGHAVFRVVALGLDRPVLAVPVLSDQVNAAVRPPPARPVVPQPHVDQPVRIPGIGFEEPLTDALELLAPLVLVV